MANGINANISSIAPPHYQPRPVGKHMSGTVTPPDDLQPAIDALSDIGRAWLYKQTLGRDILPRDLAKAADYERGDLKNG